MMNGYDAGSEYSYERKENKAQIVLEAAHKYTFTTEMRSVKSHLETYVERIACSRYFYIYIFLFFYFIVFFKFSFLYYY
jgi:hypothetical protein